MSLTRRTFLRGTAVAGAACAVAGLAEAEERKEKTLPPKAVGLLFDSTLCVGCKACVSACREANNLHPEFNNGNNLWDAPLDLSANSLTVIKAYSEGSAKNKDQEEDGFAFVKKSCLHCVDPSCVSVCPVSAMTKDPVTGIVSYNPNNCIGCRYCVAACPFGVPRFEYNKTIARLRKCEMCKQRQVAGKIPACAEVCPTGATLFGSESALRAEAERRHKLTVGERTFFPRKTVDSTALQCADLRAKGGWRHTSVLSGRRSFCEAGAAFTAGKVLRLHLGKDSAHPVQRDDGACAAVWQPAFRGSPQRESRRERG